MRRLLASIIAGALLWVIPAQAFTPGQRQVVLNGVQGWSLPNSSADLYFALNGGSCAINRIGVPCSSLISTSRASTGLAQWSDGHWSSFAANQPRITDQGVLIEQAATNLFLNSSAPVTQTITIGSTGSYTLTAWGSSGSVTVAAGTATGTGFGTATASITGGSVTFNITVTGTITCTVSGSPLYVQVESGTFHTSPIITAGSSATRAADVITLIGPAQTAALNAKAAFIQTKSSNKGISSQRFFAFSGGAFAFINDSSTVSLSDGAAHFATATLGSGITTGPVKVGYGMGSSFTTRANGGAQVSTPHAWIGNTGTVYIGNIASGSAALNGYMLRAAFGNSKGIFDGLTAP